MSFDPKQELARYRNALADAERQVALLERLISTLEREVGEARPVQPREARPRGTDAPTPRVAPVRMRRRGRGLKAVLQELTADPGYYKVDDLIRAFRAQDDFGSMPKRVSFTNRLNDLVREDWLEAGPERGVYYRPSPNGSAPSVEAEGTKAAEPDPGVIPGEGAGLGTGPPGGTD